MTDNNIFNVISNQILPLVQTPGRYIGQEENIILKEWTPEKVKIALIYPDLYEIGMSYQGFQILYHLLNHQDEIIAERCYAPWSDMEKLLRTYQLPLYSLESKRPLKDFDLLGFTLPYEMVYTNVLNILQLARIPLLSRDRTESDPVIIGGGLSAYNPEPLHPFFDLFILGEVEEIITELVLTIGKLKQSGVPKEELFQTLLDRFQGIYVPSFYTESRNGLKPLPSVRAPEKIQPIRLNVLKSDYYPDKPIIPLIEVPHNRLSLEIMRGCARGCRFCNAGFIYRPLRERPPQELANSALNNLQKNGFDELSFLSLSTSDYSCLTEVVSLILPYIRKNRISLSLPSLRADSFDESIAEIAYTGRFSGLTFAPEAGTERLRKVINKNLHEEDLYQAIQIALDKGWRQVKLYFMLGLPTENEEDLLGIVRMIKNILRLSTSSRKLEIHVTLSTFIPKPHTPFQWEQQAGVDEIQARITFLRKHLKTRRVKLNWRDPYYSLLEGAFARGDRRLSKVLLTAFNNGARLDAWREQFKPEIWEKAFRKNKIEIAEYLKAISPETPLPWDHIDIGLSREFLLEERKRAYRNQITEDCLTKCPQCGICDFKKIKLILNKKTQISIPPPAESSDSQEPETLLRYRLKYSKGDPLRFISHLDIQRLWQRILRRSGLPLAFTKGFHPKPKLSTGLPLPLGYTSEAEYLDIWLIIEESNLPARLTKVLPTGITILNLEQIPLSTPSLYSSPAIITYTFDPKKYNLNPGTITHTLNASTILIERNKKGRKIKEDIKPFLKRHYYQNDLLFLEIQSINGRTIRPDLFLEPCKNSTLPIYGHRKTVLFMKEK